MKNEYTQFQISLSTAEEETNYTSHRLVPPAPTPTSTMPSGLYRVVDGRLFQIVRDVPPSMRKPTDPADPKSA
jgi:hypothetical protein